MTTLTVEKVTTREQFAILESQWNEVLQHSASNTIALTHQWLSTWWDAFHAGRELCLLLVRDGAQLVGIAPLLKRRARHFGVLPLCRLELLASGENEFDEICSNYLDFIILKGREPEVVETILTFLTERERDWDEIVLTDVGGDSVNLPLLRAGATRRGLNPQTLREQICIYVPLTAKDDLRAGLRGPFGKNISKDLNTVRKHSDRVRTQKIEQVAEFEASFEILVRLHQTRWNARGKPGSFASEKFMRFHRQLAAPLLQRGWLKMWVLWIDDQPVCAQYDFYYDCKVFCYQSGMSITDKFLRSPGLFLRYTGMVDALENGYRECDFLKGESDSYKFNWGGQTRPIVQMRLARGGPKEWLYQSATATIERLRPLKRRLQSLRQGSPQKIATSDGA